MFRRKRKLASNCKVGIMFNIFVLQIVAFLKHFLRQQIATTQLYAATLCNIKNQQKVT